MNLNIIYIRVGYTRSGKMIPYSSASSDLDEIIKYFENACFSSDDLLDVFAVFNFLGLRAKRNGDNVSFFELYADKVQDVFNYLELDAAKDRA